MKETGRKPVHWFWLVAVAAILSLGVRASLAVRSAGLQRASPEPTTTFKAEAAELNNLGVAYMDRQDERRALDFFRRAYQSDPRLYAARLNEGIALLNMQDYARARTILVEATERAPKNPRVWYNLGLLDKTTNHTDAALRDFERVAVLDPADADTQYFLGQTYSELQAYPTAIAAFERALVLNPYHVSAEFALAQAYMRSGSAEEARVHLSRFRRINAEKLGKPMSIAYGEQGKYSLAEQITSTLAPVPTSIPVKFVDVTAQAGLPTREAPPATEKIGHPYSHIFGSGACVFDYDGDGRPDIFLVNADGSGRAALYHNLGNGRLEDVTWGSGIKIPGDGMGCTAGDYDNDGHEDLAVSYDGGIALFHNEGNGTFRDITKAAGIYVTGLVTGLTFVDYDHDGDLDLYIARALHVNSGNQSPVSAEAANQLWRNNGNGMFTEVTKETGLRGSGPSLSATASDINNDRAVDLIVTGMESSPVLYLNPREGAFKAVRPWAGPMPDNAVGVAAFDFNKDGWMDLAFTHSGAPGLTLWRNIEGKRFEPVMLPKLDWKKGWGVAPLDYDNDGWLDLVAVGESERGGQISLLRNEGPAGFRDVTKEVGLDKISLHKPRAVVPLDYDGNGATDLLLTQNDGPPILLRNEGGARNNWLKVELQGGLDNKSSMGAKVEVYAGVLRQKWEVHAASGYLSQEPSVVTAGLGNASHADIVRLLWPTGVLQDEVNFPARSTQKIVEIDRRGSSCPILFAWNGRDYQFIADILGPGIVGHWIGPGERNIPDPDEYLKVEGTVVRPRNGRLSFRLLEPMEELDYVDQLRLLAVDHPRDVEVYPNEHFASEPPFPTFQIIASRGARPPAGAWDDRGRDVLPLLLRRDHKFVSDFSAGRFQGFATMHVLEMDLGSWDASRPLRLLLDGFTDYFTADSMYAAWQAGIRPVAPYVEAQDAKGHWRRVVNDMGFPAGLERTMVADLTGKLPAGTRRIRIVTNLKIYWDRIRVDNSPESIPYRVSEVPLVGGRLEFRGYPRPVEGNPSDDLTYIYDDVSPTGPYARQAGNYTTYGDVLALLERADEEYVIFGSGDEIAADFSPVGLPALPRGWTRDYFFYADGFDKDMDFYAAYGSTVGPLPIHTLAPYPYPSGVAYPLDQRHLEYLLRYNTRAVAGAPVSSYRFNYRRELPQ